MRAQPSSNRQPRLVRVRDRSRRLAANSRKPRRSHDTTPPPEVREPQLSAGLELRVADSRHVIRIELFGDLSRANANRLSICLEHALETRAERIILDLRGLDRLEPEAVSPILIAQLTADSEHRQFLLIPGSDSVQRVLDRMQGPFSYLDPDDDAALRYDVGRSGVLSADRQQARPHRRLVELLIGPTDRLIAATEHAPEPICTLEYVGASALLGALELWLSIEDRADRSRRW
jgi:anti-anti-sigma regulatory factor